MRLLGTTDPDIITNTFIMVSLTFLSGFCQKINLSQLWRYEKHIRLQNWQLRSCKKELPF